MIHMDSSAIDAIKTHLELNKPGCVLRLALKSSGCCDPCLAMDLVDDIKQGDLTRELSGLTIAVDPIAFEATGDITIALDDPGPPPTFKLTTAKILSEWEDFCVAGLQ